MKVVTFGRSQTNNNVVIQDESVSRNHLQIVQDDNGNFTVIDLNSTNGTFVNGTRIAGKAPIYPGDTLRIGNTNLPWQTYFTSPVSIPTPVAGMSTASAPSSTPVWGKWWFWTILGLLALLLIGGIVWSTCSHSSSDQSKDKTVVASDSTEKDLKDLENEYYKANSDYQEKQAQAAKDSADYAKKQAEADRLRRIAAETQSKEDVEKAKKAKEEADAAREKARQSEQAASDAAKDLEKLKKEMAKMKNDLDEANKRVEKLTGNLSDKDTEIAELKRQNLQNSFNSALKRLKGKTKEFCQRQGWGAAIAPESTIKQHFKDASDSEKQRIINAMEDFADSLEALETTPTAPATPAPAAPDTTTKK